MIGFTGTQRGLTGEQARSLAALMCALARGIELGGSDVETIPCHHGQCVGADAEFDTIARDLGFRTIGHPASDVSIRKVSDVRSSEILKPAPALVRNGEIASMPIVIACPATFHEQQRSGTWVTIRRARKSSGTRLWIINPSGQVTVE